MFPQILVHAPGPFLTRGWSWAQNFWPVWFLQDLRTCEGSCGALAASGCGVGPFPFLESWFVSVGVRVPCFGGFQGNQQETPSFDTSQVWSQHKIVPLKKTHSLRFGAIINPLGFQTTIVRGKGMEFQAWHLHTLKLKAKRTFGCLVTSEDWKFVPIEGSRENSMTRTQLWTS